MSPEVINNDKKCGSYSDLWAIGCILYSLIYKNPPFNAITEYLIFQNINHLNFFYPESRLINIDAKNFINNLLKLNPKERLGGNGDFNELKNHKFFNQFNPMTIICDLNSIFVKNKYRKYSIDNKDVIKIRKNNLNNLNNNNYNNINRNVYIHSNKNFKNENNPIDINNINNINNLDNINNRNYEVDNGNVNYNINNIGKIHNIKSIKNYNNNELLFKENNNIDNTNKYINKIYHNDYNYNYNNNQSHNYKKYFNSNHDLALIKENDINNIDIITKHNELIKKVN